MEPYAVAADIYGEPPLTGMGGWTWYTGSAGWMYRVIVESILGIEIRNGTHLRIKPAVSSQWKEYTVEFREQEGETIHRIKVSNPHRLQSGKITGTLDGKEIKETKKEFQ